MTDVDAKALRAAAQAATQGEWEHTRLGMVRAGPSIEYVNGSSRSQIFVATGADWMREGEQLANAEFVAAWNPAVASALLDELEALRAAGVPVKGRQEYPADFEAAWDAYPPRANSNKKATFRAWAARCKAGAAVADMLAGAERYALYVLAERKEDRYRLSPATFFGPDEHYMLPWRPTRGAPARQTANDEAKRILFGGGNGAIDATR